MNSFTLLKISLNDCFTHNPKNSFGIKMILANARNFGAIKNLLKKDITIRVHYYRYIHRI